MKHFGRVIFLALVLPLFAWAKWTPDLSTLRGRVLTIQSALKQHANLLQLNLQFRRKLSDTLEPVPEILKKLGEGGTSLEIDEVVRLAMRYSSGGELIENVVKMRELKDLLKKEVGPFPLTTLADLETDLRALFKFCSTDDKIDPKRLGPELQRFFRLMPFLYDASGKARYESFTDVEKTLVSQEIEDASAGMFQNRYEDMMLRHLKKQLAIVYKAPGLGRLPEYYDPFEREFITKSGSPVQLAIQPLSGDGREGGLRNLTLERLNAVMALFRGCFGGDCSIISVPYHVLVKGVITYAIRKTTGYSGQPGGYALVAPFELEDGSIVPYIITINGALSEADVRATVKMVQHDWGTDKIVLPNFDHAGAVVNDDNMRRGMNLKDSVTTIGKLPAAWDIVDEITQARLITGYTNYYQRSILENKPLIGDARGDDPYPITKHTDKSPYQPAEDIDQMRPVDRALLGAQLTMNHGWHHSGRRDDRAEVKALLGVSDEAMAAATGVLSATPEQPMTLAIYQAAQKQFPYTIADVANLDVITAAPSLGKLHHENAILATPTVWREASEKVYRRLAKAIREAAHDAKAVRVGLKAQLSLPREFRPSDQKVLETLFPNLTDKLPEVRLTALEILYEFKKFLEEGLADISVCLKDTDEKVRKKAFEFFDQWNGKDLRVALALAEYLGAVSENDRAAVMSTAAAWKTGSSIVHAEFAKLLTHEKAEVRLSALQLLSQVPGLAPEHREAIKGRLIDSDPKVRTLTLKTVAKMWGHQASTPLLVVELIGDADSEVRKAAAEALKTNQGGWDRTVGDPVVTARLIEFLSDPVEGVRLSAAAALAELSHPYEKYPGIVKQAQALLESSNEGAVAAAVLFLGGDLRYRVREYRQYAGGKGHRPPSVDEKLAYEVYLKIVALSGSQNAAIRAQLVKVHNDIPSEDLGIQRLTAQEMGSPQSANRNFAARFWETLRAEPGRTVHDAALADLVAELAKGDHDSRGTLDEVILKLRAYDPEIDERIDDLLMARGSESLDETTKFADPATQKQYQKLTSGDFHEKMDAIYFFQYHDEASDPRVGLAAARLLTDQTESIHDGALSILERGNPSHPAVHLFLEQLLAEKEEAVVARGARALGYISGATSRHRKALMAKFASPNGEIRLQSVKAVAGLFGKNVLAQRALAERLGDEVAEVGEAAARALREQIKDEGNDAAMLAQLVKLLASENRGVREKSAGVLQQLSRLYESHEGVVRGLLGYLHTGSVGSKAAAASVLERGLYYRVREARGKNPSAADQLALEVYDALVGLAKTKDQELGEKVVFALHDIICEDPAVQLLAATAIHGDRSPRTYGYEFWKKQTADATTAIDEKAINQLIKNLSNPVPATREQSDDILARIRRRGSAYERLVDRKLSRRKASPGAPAPSATDNKFAEIFSDDENALEAALSNLQYGSHNLTVAAETRLVQLIIGPNASIAERAAEIIQKQRSARVGTRHAISGYLMAEDPVTVRHALKTLATLTGVPLIDERKVLPLFGHPDADVRRAALSATTVSIRSEVATLRGVAKLVGDPFPNIRTEARAALKLDYNGWDRTTDDAQVVDQLVTLLEHESDGVRLDAASAISEMRNIYKHNAPLVRRLFALLDHGTPDVQAAVASALSDNLRYAVREYFSAVRQGESKIPEDEELAFEAFQKLVALTGTDHEPLADELLHALYEIPTPESGVQRLAARALGRTVDKVRNHAKSFWTKLLEGESHWGSAAIPAIDAEAVFTLLDLTESGGQESRTAADEIVRLLRAHPDGWEPFIDEYLRLKAQGGSALATGKEELLAHAQKARDNRRATDVNFAAEIERGELNTRLHEDAATKRLAETKARITDKSATPADGHWLLLMLGSDHHNFGYHAGEELLAFRGIHEIDWKYFRELLASARGKAVSNYLQFLNRAKPPMGDFLPMIQAMIGDHNFDDDIQALAIELFAEGRDNDAAVLRKLAAHLPSAAHRSARTIGAMIAKATPAADFTSERKLASQRLLALFSALDGYDAAHMAESLGRLGNDTPEIFVQLAPYLTGEDADKKFAVARVFAFADPANPKWNTQRRMAVTILLDALNVQTQATWAGLSLAPLADVFPPGTVERLRKLLMEGDTYLKWGPGYALANLDFDQTNLDTLIAAKAACSVNGMDQAFDWMINNLREKDPNCATKVKDAAVVIHLED